VTLRRVLVELAMTEQRYRAVLEVQAGVPVTEVAERFGVTRVLRPHSLGEARQLGELGELEGLYDIMAATCSTIM